MFSGLTHGCEPGKTSDLKTSITPTISMFPMKTFVQSGLTRSDYEND